MALHYSSGIGNLYDKEINKPISRINYQLIEIDPTKYTKKKWWGEFYSSKIIKKSGVYRIELEDGKSGDCVICVKDDFTQDKASQFHYHFNGRGKLGRGYGK
ncbi:MAG TPA: hypothetical protein G4O19_03570 [Dehalococcoidia bacterium]|nr:hypothetical protein [Dehalococcoidia bacterium]